VQSKILRKKLLSDNLISNLMVGSSGNKESIVVIPTATNTSNIQVPLPQSQAAKRTESSSLMLMQAVEPPQSAMQVLKENHQP
jgi:hypothetical protein